MNQKEKFKKFMTQIKTIRFAIMSDWTEAQRGRRFPSTLKVEALRYN